MRIGQTRGIGLRGRGHSGNGAKKRRGLSLEDMRSRWARAVDGSAPGRVITLLLPGLGVGVFVLLFLAIARGSVTSGALAIAGLAFTVVSLGRWRGSRAARFDRTVAEELLRRQGWDEPIEFVVRPVGVNLIWRGTFWIATDRRLIEASRPLWWRPRQPQSVLWSVGYDGITAIHSVSTRSGQGPGVTTITLTLSSDQVKMTFSPRKAKAILASVTDHTGLPPT